jgi:mannose/fructose/N-acetylgalactosamine-specific phosphotransferase system component IIB
MKNVVLFRIDDRLIHGQVCTGWIKQCDANEIVCIDDKLVNDTMMQRVLKAAAPKTTPLSIFTVEQGAEYLMSAEPGHERIIVLVKFPDTIERLINAGVKIEKLNLGGLGFRGNRKNITKSVSADEEEIACLKRILETGTYIFYQMTNRDAPVDFSTVLAKL